MVQAFAVLYAATPPDSAKVAALFVVGAMQDAAGAEARANAFRDAHFPTSVVQPCTLDAYNTNVVITS
jgi:hypothetical protein